MVRRRHHRWARIRLGPAFTLVLNLGNLSAWEIRFGDCLIHCLSCSTPPIVSGVDTRKTVGSFSATGARRHRRGFGPLSVGVAPDRLKE